MRAVVAVLLLVTAAHAALWGLFQEKQQAPDFSGILPSVSYAPFEGTGHPTSTRRQRREDPRRPEEALDADPRDPPLFLDREASNWCRRSPPNSA